MFSPRLSCRFLALILTLTFWLPAIRATQTEPGRELLQLGNSIVRQLSKDETHSYTITLAANQFAYIVVDQRGIDLAVVLYDVNGTRLVKIDSPNSNYGHELVSLVAGAAGTYRIDVQSQSRYKTSGSYELRLKELRSATEQDHRRFAAQNFSVEAKALRNKKTKESYRQAIEKYHQALEIRRNSNDKLSEAFTLHELGLLYGDTGQYQKALDVNAQARSLYKSLGNRRGEVSVLSNTGYIYGELGDNQKALETYNEVAEAYRTMGHVDPVLLSNIGASYGKLRQYQRALEIHLRVLEMRRALQDSLGEAITLNNIANCYDRLGQKSKALEFYNQTLVLMRANGDDYYTATTLHHLGAFYRNQGEHEKGLDYFNEALKLRQTVGDENGIAATLAHMARLERERGNLFDARKRIEAALAVIERQRSKVTSQQLRATYLASMQQYREFYVDLLMRLHLENPSAQFDREAFNASETGRARSLLELLSESGREIRHGVDPLLLERERGLAQLIATKADSQMRLISGKHTEEEALAAAREIATLTAEYEQVQARIRAMSPQYAALVQPVPLKLEEIQQRVVNSDTLLLEYMFGEEKSFLWAVTSDAIKSYELPRGAIIDELARRVYAHLTARNLNIPKETLEQRRQRLNDAEAEYQKESARLSEILLGPVAAELKNRRLLIVTDGVMQFVPFAGLPHPIDSNPLIVRHEIVTVPSASLVALLRQEAGNRKPAPKTLAVFADPVFSKDDSRVSARRSSPATPEETYTNEEVVRAGAESGLAHLRRLRFSRQEADEILRFAGEVKLQAVDFDANRKLATSAELGQYQIVHFATHGLINNRHPELSGVVLSLVDDRGQPQNGFLRLYDLYNLKLSAELVVLSACQTALGKEIRGEGLVGLTRGFMYAGAPRVIASLWQIDDRASAEFMKRFYHELLVQKLRPAAALRAAQVSMQHDKRWKDPHYWAAFSLQGEWR